MNRREALAVLARIHAVNRRLAEVREDLLALAGRKPVSVKGVEAWQVEMGARRDELSDLGAGLADAERDWQRISREL